MDSPIPERLVTRLPDLLAGRGQFLPLQTGESTKNDTDVELKQRREKNQLPVIKLIVTAFLEYPTIELFI